MTPLSPAARALLGSARRATLATLGPGGRPRLVPICFVVAERPEGTVLYTPLDDKPKGVADYRELARVRDILARPDVSVLVDRWSEDWSDLAWLRLDGIATLLEPGDEQAAAVAALRAKHLQYREHALDGRPLIRIAVLGSRGWGVA